MLMGRMAHLAVKVVPTDRLFAFLPAERKVFLVSQT
jgi:hypothetical protein